MKNLIIIIVCAIIVCLCVNNDEYITIPSTSIRMRVIAASNDIEDQKDKLIVKSALEETIKSWKSFEQYEDIDEFIIRNKQNIDAEIKTKLVNQNRNIIFNSNYGYNYFPEKEWRGVKYPSGNYKSYVITIGEGAGENWWCVLFPPLCLIDNKQNDYEYHSLIKDVLTQYN